MHRNLLRVTRPLAAAYAVWLAMTVPAIGAQGRDGDSEIVKRLDRIESIERRLQDDVADIKRAVIAGARPQTTAAPLVYAIDLAKTLGHAADVIVEFSDCQCPYCGQFAAQTFPEVRRRFVDTGAIEYAFVNFPLDDIHPHALEAAVASECAKDQHVFWAMHDALFRHQGSLGHQNLIDYARELDVDAARFEMCLAGDDSSVRQQQRSAREASVSSTPTFFLGELTDGNIVRVSRRLTGAAPTLQFINAVQSYLDAKHNRPTP